MMLRLYNYLFSAEDKEKGAVLVLFLFIFAALLALAGLAIDAGNLYRARLQLQKAADAGVLAGIGTTIVDRQKIELAIETRANAVRNDNLALAGIELHNSTAETHYNTDTEQIVVHANAEIDFLLMDAVPFFILGLDQAPSKALLSAVAVGKRAEANIALVLDYSFSMDCPGTGNCSCQTPDRGNQTCAQQAAQLGVNQKVDDLRAAVLTFLNYFDPDRDRISLIPFSTAAQVSIPVKVSPDRGFDTASFQDYITGSSKITPIGNTNVCDGFMRAYADMRTGKIIDNADPRDDQQVAYVYFSDGAPTAARLLLTNPKAVSGIDSPGLGGSYDYIHYTVEWVNPAGHFAGPSQLIKTPGIPFNYAVGTPVVGSTPACSVMYTPPTDKIPDAQAQVPYADSVFAACVNNLGFHMPYQAVPVYGSEYGGTEPFTSWREQYYNCAVETGDFVRDHNGLIYVVGLGNPAAELQDPYQDVNDTLSRKDIFLTRMALDCDGTSKHLDFDFGQTGGNNAKPRTWADYAKDGRAKCGAYLKTTNSAELESLFKRIAMKIRLRLL